MACVGVCGVPWHHLWRYYLGALPPQYTSTLCAGLALGGTLTKHLVWYGGCRYGPFHNETLVDSESGAAGSGIRVCATRNRIVNNTDLIADPTKIDLGAFKYINESDRGNDYKIYAVCGDGEASPIPLSASRSAYAFPVAHLLLLRLLARFSFLRIPVSFLCPCVATARQTPVPSALCFPFFL